MEERPSVPAIAPPVVVPPVVTVTPHLELEYKVVLLDRKLGALQEPTEVKYPTDSTFVLLSLTQAGDSPKFTTKGAILSATPADAVEVYEDEALTTKLDLAAPIANAKVMGGAPYKVWLKGLKKGKFDLKLKVEEPADGRFKAAPEVVAKMAVVELEFKLHQFDAAEVKALQVDPDAGTLDEYHTKLKDKALPEQKEMTDSQKVKDGRLLHVQDGTNAGRAKLLIKKLSAADWPADTDDYKLVLRASDSADATTASSAIDAYDGDADVSAAVQKALPLELRVGDLKAADTVLWIEGKSASKKKVDIRLDLGLDRPDAAPDKKAKRNGDWGRFTVVKIKEITVDYTPEVGKAPAWDEGSGKFFVNLKGGDAGRKVTLRAELTEKIKGVPLHFALTPDKDNGKTANWGVDLPGTWVWKDIDAKVKHKDRADRKDLLHFTADTDEADGRAKVEVTLSRFGGDKFTPAAYIQQDPHLAKYVHGHADLEKRKPVLSAKPILVWRKFWYQRVVVDGIACPAFAGAEGQYDRVKADMVAAPDLQLTRATVNGYNPQAVYPRYMVEVNGGNGDALVVSDPNKNQFFTTFAAAADKPNMIPILVCDAQWDPDGDSAAFDSPDLDPASFPADFDVAKDILSPPLQGGDLLVSGQWLAADWDPAANGGAGDWTNVRNGLLSNGDLSVNANRTSIQTVTVALPAGVGATTASTKVWIQQLVVQGAAHYLGESFNRRILAVYDPNEAADFQNTIAHELGHAYGQVIKGDPAGGVAGVPKHPNQKDKGQGNHCRNLVNKCVMYDSGPIVGSLNRYCDMCHPYLLVQDMSTIV